MKILVVRFSSIGDVVLTTPIVRCLKKQLPEAEVHFITKKAFAPVLEDNLYLDKLITIQKSIKEVIVDLKKEKYDWIIDLHKNVRTLSLKKKIGVQSKSFPKLNIEKWLFVQFKINQMTSMHIVDRYFETVKHLGVKNDLLPCDFFINKTSQINIEKEFQLNAKSFLAIAIGAQFATKRLPFSKLKEIIQQINTPIVLVGGAMDKALAIEIQQTFPTKKIHNACGDFSLQQSASIIEQSKAILSNDTGLMHIASCFQIPTISIWGNTVPDLGMFPYFPNQKQLFSMHEVENLKCRPCSKIGFKECPKKHFKCMNLQDSEAIISDIKDKMN
ncbi:MAG: glycosyltransferase family 9 protein [Flavobacteriia bacterium]|nr:glycosyltransferase family 9 protein [Flavobacteriia bacterium]